MIDNLFEIIMLICFGVAWPFTIHKAYTTKSNGGMSLIFLLVVIAGYAAGIMNNVIGGITYVIIFYLANLIMVTVNTILFINNIRYEKCEVRS